MDFRTTTVEHLATEVARRRTSAREVTQAALDRIEALDPSVNAFVAVDGERALADAAALDERLAAGEPPGPLAGIPVGVKDLEDAAGFRTSYGSALHVDDPPATEDSPLVARLKAAGCIVVGKTNTPELGWKGHTDNVPFGATRNPWDLDRSAGGSSGGAAAALASGMVPLATGSDGGGSIRIPSSACGLSGHKPSLGRVPSGGPHPASWGDLSTKGPMACRIRDVVLALDAVIGPDPTDLRSLPMPEASWSRSLVDLHVPHRVGWSPTLGYARVDREVAAICEAALRRLEDLGTEVVPVETVFDRDPAYDWLTLAMAGNLRTLGHLRGTPAWKQVEPDHAAMLELMGGRLTASAVIEAMDACHHANLRLVEVFHRVPLLLTPTLAGQVGAAEGPAAGQGTIDGEADLGWVAFTYPFNMTRSPAGTVCAGFSSAGLPVGLQVVGPQHADVAVLRLLAVLEDALAVDRSAPVGG